MKKTLEVIMMELNDISITQLRKDRQEAVRTGTIVTDPVRFREHRQDRKALEMIWGFIILALAIIVWVWVNGFP
jgi:hypothetical protein